MNKSYHHDHQRLPRETWVAYFQRTTGHSIRVEHDRTTQKARISVRRATDRHLDREVSRQ